MLLPKRVLKSNPEDLREESCSMFLSELLTLKWAWLPEIIFEERSLENCWIWGRIYFRNEKLFHLPWSIITDSLVPASTKSMAKDVRIECVPILDVVSPKISGLSTSTVALRWDIKTALFMNIGFLFFS